MDDILNISEIINTPVRQLSLGQRMRGDLTAAVLHSPQILFLDEPTIGLDILRKKQLEKCLLTLKSEKKGFMIISHEPNFLEKYVDKLLILSSKGVEVI